MKFTNEIKIALVAIAAIVVLFFGLQFLKGLSMYSSDDDYYACFDNVSGLTASTAVYANGYRVGVVEEIIYDYDHPDHIVARMSIDPRVRLPRDSRAEISSDLLGNVSLELNIGSAYDSIIQRGDTLMGGQKKGAMGKAADMIPQIEVMLPKLDSILTSVNMLLADPALRSSLHHVDEITASLDKASRELGQLSASLNLQVPKMLTKADGVLENTEGLTRQLNNIDVASTMSKVDKTLLNVQQMTDALNSKEGTLGLLMHDPQLYYNLSATAGDADKLLIDFKEHPKRYVHFSVFGKKDK